MGRIFMMKKWEYKVMAVATNVILTTKQYEKAAEELEAQMNELGQEGWELVQRMDGFFFFKREKALL